MSTAFQIVDVFAQQPLAGNPLAVVIAAHDLSEAEMLRFAAEFNFSETTFVDPQPRPGGAYSVRIFTPAREIAFAGHPILGTAWVVREHIARGGAAVTLDLPVGPVTVDFEPSGAGRDVAWFRAPPVTPGARLAPEAIAAAVGLTAQDIDERAPAQQMGAGTAALIVPVRDARALQRARLDLQAFAPLAGAGFAPLVYLFCLEPRHPANHVRARFFFEAFGVREDPATGNGAAFLGRYLLEHPLLPGAELSLRIEQGEDVHRPSLVQLRARRTGATFDIRVGGHVLPVARGELL